MIAFAASAALVVLIALTLMRLFAGPTIYDRALAVNGVVLKAALLCATLAVAFQRSEGVEAAFVLMFGLFVLNTATLKVFRARTFQAPLAREEPE